MSENTSQTSIYASSGMVINCKRVSCNGEFTPVRTTQQFCSSSCRLEHHKEVVVAGEQVMARRRKKSYRSSRSNYARLTSSPRLQRIYKLLKDGRWYTTRGIINIANVCAVSQSIHELRCNGLDIECRYKDGNYEYQLQ